MIEAKEVKALLYGCGTWTTHQNYYKKPRNVHHRILLRIFGATSRKPDHSILSYNCALERSRPNRIILRREEAFVGGVYHQHVRSVVAKAGHVRDYGRCGGEGVG